MSSPIISDTYYHARNDFSLILNPYEQDVDVTYGVAKTDFTRLGDESSASGSSSSLNSEASCLLKNCCVCAYGLPSFYASPPTWAEVCHLAMYALSTSEPSQSFFHIRKHICEFIEAHYEVLVQRERTDVWKQTVNMTLSHPQYSDIFIQEQSLENGRKGFYALRELVDPYQRNGRRRPKRSANELEGFSQSSAICPYEDPSKRFRGEDSPVRREDPETKEDIKKLEMEVFMYFAKQKRSDDEEGGSDHSDDATSLVTVDNDSKSKRGRQATKPEEKAILEQYYTFHFQKYAKHTRRAKSELDELARKLGWKVSRIQRWLDNRRTKDKTKGMEAESKGFSDPRMEIGMIEGKQYIPIPPGKPILPEPKPSYLPQPYLSEDKYLPEPKPYFGDRKPFSSPLALLKHEVVSS